jgi:hypothetical protein
MTAILSLVLVRVRAERADRTLSSTTTSAAISNTSWIVRVPSLTVVQF